MKTLHSERNLSWLGTYDEKLGFDFVLSNRDIYKVIQACPKLKITFAHQSLLERMPCLDQKLLSMQKIEVVDEDENPLKYVKMCNTCIWRPHLRAS
jgi:hypothetical protein